MPTFERPYCCILKVYRMTKKSPQEIIAFLDKAVAQFPKEANWLLERANAKVAASRELDAFVDFQKAFALNPALKKQANEVFSKDPLMYTFD